MIKKTISFSDLDGNQVTEDYYFNLTKAEVAEMELSKTGGLSAHLQRIVDSQDPSEIVGTFKEIILTSIGRRSEDGKRFIKNQEIREEFMQTDAYSELFMELISNASGSADFIKGILPSDLQNRQPDAKILPAPATEVKKDPTTMSREELLDAMKAQQARRQNEGFSD